MRLTRYSLAGEDDVCYGDTYWDGIVSLHWITDSRTSEPRMQEFHNVQQAVL
jgi:hypothetical protein